VTGMTESELPLDSIRQQATEFSREFRFDFNLVDCYLTIMKKAESSNLKNKCSFLLSLRYEFFYALQAVLQTEARIHQSWKQDALARLPETFHDETKKLGFSSEIWAAIADTLPGSRPALDYTEMVVLLREQDVNEFAQKLLLAMLHIEEIVDALLGGRTDLLSALNRLPKSKHEWLTFVGLYPYAPQSPMVAALEFLLSSPDRFKETVLAIMEIFWKHCFAGTWQDLRPQLQRSCQEKERLFHSCSFDEFARQALLRIHVDETREQIEAVRGGYKLRYRDVAGCYFMPSAFNDRRYWTALSEPDASHVHVYFPFFDPAIVLDLQKAAPAVSYVEPELDPAMIFKALGDSTRYAIASMIARQPTHSVELARRLGVSKPTVSHHVNQLREAGLISEEYKNGCVLISLRRDIIEKLSDLAVRKLFESEASVDLTTSRKKSV
jgi:DNA-binding transcriptional ArsR family regulator